MNKQRSAQKTANKKKMIHEHLYSQECLSREAAARFLAASKSPLMAEALAAEFKNKNRFVAIRAAWGLTLMPKEIAIPVLIKALRTPDADISHHAGWALNHISGVLGDKALVAALKDESPIVRKEAVSGLRGKLVARTSRVQNTLIRMLKGDMGAATLTLGAAQGNKALAALASALKDKTFPSRAMAILALARAKDTRALTPALDMLIKANDMDKSTALWALRLLDAPEALTRITDFVSRLGRENGYNTPNHAVKTIDSLKRTAAAKSFLRLLPNKDYKVRLSGVVALGAVAATQAVPHLIKMLGDKQWLVRGTAAEALGTIADENAINPLLASLKDKSWYVRQHAALAIGKLKAPKAVPALLSALKDKNDLVRVAAANALKELAAPSIAGKMIKGLSDKNPFIRQASAEALGKIKALAAVPALIKLLSHEHWAERVRAAEALGNIGDSRAIKPLKRCLKDNSAEVFLAAEKAINRIEAKPTNLRYTYECRIS